MCDYILTEGFFDVPETKEGSSSEQKTPEKLNVKARDAYLLFQVLITYLLSYSNHFMCTGYSSVNQWRPSNMVTS